MKTADGVEIETGMPVYLTNGEEYRVIGVGAGNGIMLEGHGLEMWANPEMACATLRGVAELDLAMAKEEVRAQRANLASALKWQASAKAKLDALAAQNQ